MNWMNISLLFGLRPSKFSLKQLFQTLWYKLLRHSFVWNNLWSCTRRQFGHTVNKHVTNDQLHVTTFIWLAILIRIYQEEENIETTYVFTILLNILYLNVTLKGIQTMNLISFISFLSQAIHAIWHSRGFIFWSFIPAVYIRDNIEIFYFCVYKPACVEFKHLTKEHFSPIPTDSCFPP